MNIKTSICSTLETYNNITMNNWAQVNAVSISGIEKKKSMEDASDVDLKSLPRRIRISCCKTAHVNTFKRNFRGTKRSQSSDAISRLTTDQELRSPYESSLSTREENNSECKMSLGLKTETFTLVDVISCSSQVAIAQINWIIEMCLIHRRSQLRLQLFDR